jgi:hypothetical protein
MMTRAPEIGPPDLDPVIPSRARQRRPVPALDPVGGRGLDPFGGAMGAASEPHGRQLVEDGVLVGSQLHLNTALGGPLNEVG